jgi:hypothetical protein
MTPHQALLAAVESLPSNGDDFDVGAKTLASAGLSEDKASAKAFLRNFAAWARAYAPTVPDVVDFEATDYQDYYKLVMSRVQYIYARCTDDVGDGPLATFQTHLRRNPQFTSPAGTAHTLCVLELEPSATPPPAGCYTQCDAKFREVLAAVGARKFRAQTLRLLLASRCAKMGRIEDSLGGMTDEWIAALDGTRLFTLLSPGEDFTNGTRCEVKIVIYNGHAVVLARGPWWRVTFVETAVLQCVCQFLIDEVNARSEGGAVGWHSEAIASFALWAHQVERKVHGPKKATVSFFSGRRAPSTCFHLLQHMYLSTLWGQGFTTSSCLAARVLAPLGRPQELHGTSAHEGPMAFMALCPELDSTVPVSSMLWTILFWASTSNTSILPDTFGSATFKQMLSDVGLLDEVSTARQDSGRLDRFKEIFAPFPCMASEVSKFADIEQGMALGCAGRTGHVTATSPLLAPPVSPPPHLLFPISLLSPPPTVHPYLDRHPPPHPTPHFPHILCSAPLTPPRRYVGFGVGGALGERRREHKEMSIAMKLVEIVSSLLPPLTLPFLAPLGTLASVWAAHWVSGVASTRRCPS